ncbi:hypothetical protein [Sphingomonas sp.]|uniref:hypothetical protein n=1 Tax=Sphingomonas sp. TaxID=28214 RepID=UPI0031D493CF
MRHVVLTTCLLLAACGSSEKSATVAGATFTSDESKGTSSITTEQGTIRVADGTDATKVVMPGYAPVYPGASVTGVVETENNGRKLKMVTLSSADPVAKVVEFYKGTLNKEGWKLPSSLISGETGMISGQKDGKEVSIVVSREDDGKTNMVISIPDNG